MQVIEKEGWGEKDVRPQGARAFEAVVGQWMGSLFPALRRCVRLCSRKHS